MNRVVCVGDVVRSAWGVHEVAEVDDTPHGRLLRLRLGEDEVEPWAWIGASFVQLVSEQVPLFDAIERLEAR